MVESPVTLPPGLARLFTNPLTMGSVGSNSVDVVADGGLPRARVSSATLRQAPSSQAWATPLMRAEIPAALSGEQHPLQCGDINWLECVRDASFFQLIDALQTRAG